MFSIHGMTLVLQVQRGLPDDVERGFQELLVDQRYEVEVHLRLALCHLVEQRPRNLQHTALRPNR